MHTATRTICLEEHFATHKFLAGPGKSIVEQASRFGPAVSKLISVLTDLGDGRIAEMDSAGIDLSILSLTSPGTEQLGTSEAIELAIDANDLWVRRFLLCCNGLTSCRWR